MRRVLYLLLFAATLMVGYSNRGYSASGLDCNDREVHQYLKDVLAANLRNGIAQNANLLLSVGLTNEDGNPLLPELFGSGVYFGNSNIENHLKTIKASQPDLLTRIPIAFCPANATKISKQYCKLTNAFLDEGVVRAIGSALSVELTEVTTNATDPNCGPEQCINYCQLSGTASLKLETAVNGISTAKNVIFLDGRKDVLDLNESLRTMFALSSFDPQNPKVYKDVGAPFQTSGQPGFEWVFGFEYCTVLRGEEKRVLDKCQ